MKALRLMFVRMHGESRLHVPKGDRARCGATSDGLRMIGMNYPGELCRNCLASLRRDGRAAFAWGIDHVDVQVAPYPSGTPEFLAFQEGWNEARIDYIRLQRENRPRRVVVSPDGRSVSIPVAGGGRAEIHVSGRSVAA